MSAQPTTSEYMMLFRGTQWDKNLSPEQIQTVMNQWNAWFDRLIQQGKIKSAHPLEREGKIVSGKKGRSVADGPFAESKEAIGGYFLMQVDGPDEALAIAQKWPAVECGVTVEVLPATGQCPTFHRSSHQVA